MTTPVTTMQHALFGNPPVEGYKPSREGVLTAFGELYDVAVAEALAAGIYVNEATGRAAVADNVIFSAIGSTSAKAIDIWQRVNSGSSTLLRSYPSLAALASFLTQARALTRTSDIFRYERATVNSVINSSTGAIYTDGGLTSFYATDYMSCVPGGSLTFSHATTILAGFGIAYYDADKTYISGVSGDIPTTALTVPAGAYYFRASVMADTMQFLTISDGTAGVGGINRDAPAIQHDIMPWHDTKWVAQGDSITALYDWLGRVAAKQGAKLQSNWGLSSRKMDKALFRADNTTALVSSDFDNIDLVFLWIGTNDAQAGTTMGTIADSTATASFYGYTKKFIEQVLTWKPRIKIVILTPISSRTSVSYASLLAVRNALIEMGTYYGMPVIDIFAKSGLNAINYATFSSDGIHPNGNTAGYAPILNLVNRDLLSIGKQT